MNVLICSLTYGVSFLAYPVLDINMWGPSLRRKYLKKFSKGCKQGNFSHLEELYISCDHLQHSPCVELSGQDGKSQSVNKSWRLQCS